MGQLWSRPNIESFKRIYYCSNPRSETFFTVMSSSKAIPLRCQSGDPSLFPQCHFHKVTSYQGLFACALLSLKRRIETSGIQVLLFLFFHKSTKFSQITIAQTFPDNQKRKFAANSNRTLILIKVAQSQNVFPLNSSPKIFCQITILNIFSLGG